MGITLSCLLVVGGCDKAEPAKDAAANPNPTKPAEPAEVVQPEPWITKPVEQWPQIVLSNQAKFRGSTALEGASAFLLKSSDGKVVAATARHLLGVNGGVEPAVLRSKLGSFLESWKIFPRTDRTNSVELGSLAMSHPESSKDDWLLLELKNQPATLPAAPLRARRRAVAVGEHVNLVGVSYAEPNVRQRVYSGKVTQRGNGGRFRYDINPPVDIRGFSGAPVLDDDGIVVGVMSVWFTPKMKGEQMLEAGGEDAAVIFGVLNSK